MIQGRSNRHCGWQYHSGKGRKGHLQQMEQYPGKCRAQPGINGTEEEPERGGRAKGGERKKSRGGKGGKGRVHP